MMTAVRIGYDARAAFLDPARGFGRVTRALAGALLELAPGAVVVFVPHGADVPSGWYPRAAEVVQLRRPRRPAFLVDPLAWQLALRRHRVDVLHLPAWGVPPGLPVPVVATFYDAIPFRFLSPPERWRRRRAQAAIRSLARAERLHAISAFAREEAIGAVGLRGDRLVAVPLGVDPQFRPGGGAREPFLLFIGGADPHKNLPLLLDAVAGPDELPRLRVAGPAAAAPWLRQELARRRLGERVELVATRSDEDLIALYRTALATLMPSLCEGFGLPALEAMACGCPVLASRAGALPEVCGEAAWLLPPDDPGAWRRAVLALVASPNRCGALSTAGLARAASFTWERTAAGLLELYREAARAASSRR